jgi:cytoskeletal protein RodZ
MTLQSFGEELRRLRQDRRISLMDISSSTRINLKFLEAIENGRFSVLPQTYIRAFLREYADSVGASPEEVLKKYDEAVSEESGLPKPGTSKKDDKEPPLQALRSASSFPLFRKSNLMFAAVAVVALGLTAYILSSGPGEPTPRQTPEVSFDTVVRETEASTLKNVSAAPSVPTVMPKQDSLRLEMITKDSVWMSILIDGKRTEEYLFPPNHKKTWIAKERFSLTMGNAGGATFVLNGKELGVLGKRGAVIRNAIIEESLLHNL